MMLLISIFIIGLIFSLIAIFRNADEEYLKGISKTITVFSILLCIIQINQTTNNLLLVNFLVCISMISFLIYQFSETDIR
jgi:hypothetical protein